MTAFGLGFMDLSFRPSGPGGPPPPPPGDPYRFTVSNPPPSISTAVFPIAMSPDGNTMVATANTWNEPAEGANPVRNGLGRIWLFLYDSAAKAWNPDVSFTDRSIVQGSGTPRWGSKVALSADGLTMIVSSPFAGSPTRPTIANGVVTVWQKAAGVWAKTQTFYSPTPDASNPQNETFGNGLYLTPDGSRLVVLAQGVSKTFVYARQSDGTYALEATLGAHPLGVIAPSDAAITADGATIIVGYGNSSPGGVTFAGGVARFTRTGTAWSAATAVPSPNPTLGTRFGGFVAMFADGSGYVTTASAEDANFGAVYVFDIGASAPKQRIVSAARRSEGYGAGLNVLGDGSILIGATNRPTAIASNAGQIERRSAAGALLGTFESKEATSVNFGSNIKAAGDHFVAGGGNDQVSAQYPANSGVIRSFSLAA